jgi:hypothetical protein
MQCEHCLRGARQNVNIPKHVIKEFFSKLSGVGCLTLSGGEPSMAVKQISYVINAIKKYNVSLGSFYIATNGKRISQKFMAAILKLYMLSEDKSFCGIHVSIDDYHDNKGSDGIELLKALSFTKALYRRYYRLLGQGLALDNGIGDVSPSCELYDIYNNEIHEGAVYLNALGDIIAGCDRSYEEQLNQKVCNYNDDLIAAFTEWMANK